MSTLYVHTLTVVCPETMFNVGNTLAYLFGESGAGNLETFKLPRWTLDDDSGEYAIEPAQCKAALAGVILSLSAGSLPALPTPWPENLPATQAEVVEALQYAQVITDFDHLNPPGYTSGLVFILDLNWQELVKVMGFRRLPDEE